MHFQKAAALARKAIDSGDTRAIEARRAAKAIVFSHDPQTMDEAIAIMEIATTSLSSEDAADATVALERVKNWLSGRYQPSQKVPEFSEGIDQVFTMEQMAKSLLAQPHPEFGTYEAWLEHVYATAPVAPPGNADSTLDSK